MADSSNQPTLPLTSMTPSGELTLGTVEFDTGAITDGGQSLVRVPGYAILAEIGRGGMGVVYKARHLALSRDVALKTVLAGNQAGPVEVIRFRQEAESIARLDHPNIVQVYEVGAVNGQSYLALEYVGGGDLARKTAGVPQPPREAAGLVETLAAAVHHAHAQGIIHRDLKPANILLTPDGVPKITDFGLARHIGDTSGLTVTHAILGTPAYMSPEQASGHKEVGPATDIYALGAILYDLLTGRPPFQGATPVEILRRVTDDEPVPVRRVRPDCHRDLDVICLKCLHKNPAKRYASAASLADDLHRFLADEPITARPAGRAERLFRWARRHPGTATLLGLTAVLLLVIAVGGVAMSLQLNQALGRAREDRDTARRAVREGKDKLLQSLVSEAKANRFSRRVGQRFDTLEAVRKAAELARELESPPSTFDELRTLAIAALTLPDVEAADVWLGEPLEPGWIAADGGADPQFRRYAVSDAQGAIRIRRIGSTLADSTEVARLPGLGVEVILRWSPDGRFLAARHFLRRRLQVWDLDRAEPALTIEENSQCLDADFSPDSRRLVSVGAGQLRIYDLADGQRTHTFAVQNPGQRHLAHHPRLPQVALCLQNGVSIVDLATGETVRRLPLTRPTLHAAWHPHGELLAVTTENHVHVWDALRGRQHWQLDHPGGGLHVAFAPRGDTLASSGWHGGVKFWNPHTGAMQLAIERSVTFPRIGPDGLLTEIHSNSGKRFTGPLARFEAASGYRTLIAGPGLTQGWNYRNCSLHPGGRLLAVGTLQGLSLMDLKTGQERAFVPIPASAVLFEPSGTLLTTTTTAGVQRWPVQDDPAAPLRLRVGPPEPVPVRARWQGGHLARSEDGAVLAVGSIDGAFVWRRDQPDKALRLAPHHECRSVAVSPDGTLVATGSQAGPDLKVWDAATGALVCEFDCARHWTIPAFSPDGRWLTNRDGQCWRVADWSTGPLHPGEHGAAFAPDMRLCAWGGHKGFIPLVDPATGRELARLEDPHQDTVTALTFSPDGTQLLGVSNESLCVRVWDLRALRQGLVSLGLDWDAPPYPPTPADVPDGEPLQVELAGAQEIRRD